MKKMLSSIALIALVLSAHANASAGRSSKVTFLVETTESVNAATGASQKSKDESKSDEKTVTLYGFFVAPAGVGAITRRSVRNIVQIRKPEGSEFIVTIPQNRPVLQTVLSMGASETLKAGEWQIAIPAIEIGV